MNKKGLSDVVTNVLIIVLVIVAIGIIAAFVVPLLRNAGTTVNEGTSCLSVNVGPTNCVVNATNQTKLTISRGAGTYDIADVKVIFDKSDGSADVRVLNATQRAMVTEFATVVMNVNGSTNYKPTSASLAVQLVGANSNCPQTAKVACISG